MKLPPYLGHLTNDVISSRLAPGVLDEIKNKNPVIKSDTAKRGYRRNKNFQWLTEDVGAPKLHQHISNTVTLMKAVPDGGWDFFKELLNRSMPPWSKLPILKMIEQAEEAAHAEEAVQR